MVDISQTPANVVKGSNASVIQVTAGVTVLAGEVVYRDSTDSDEYKLAIDTSAAAAAAIGIALNRADDGQPLTVQTSGDIDVGGTVKLGKVYCVSSTAGAIAEVDDTSTSDWVTVLGTGESSSVLPLNIRASGVQAAEGVA